MAEFEIHCPYHGTTEKLTLPDSYQNRGFEGEVTCASAEGGGGRPFILKIKISAGHVVALERAK